MPLIIWLEGAQWRYFAVADTTLAIVLGLVVAGALWTRVGAWLESGNGSFAFAGLVLAALAAARWPTFFVLHRMNPDEAQMAAQAITALKFPIPWSAFDSGSSGPLNTYVLLLPMLVGVHPTFMTARMIAVLLEFGSFAAMYAAIRSVAQPWVARAAVVPPLIFWCVSTQEDYVHYSSEHLPIFLATLAVALVALGRTRYYPRVLAYTAGVLVGALPFAKLQSAPIGLAVFALAAVAYLSCTALTVRERFARIVSLVQGTCTIPFVLCVVLIWGDSFSDFRHSYIETSLAYVIPQARLWWFLTATSEFGPYFSLLAPIALAGLIALALAFRRIAAPLRGGFAASLLVLFGAIYAIESPGRTSPHYLLFAIVPLAASSALALSVIAQSLRGLRFARFAPAVMVCAFVIAGALVERAFARTTEPWIGLDFSVYMWPGAYDPIAEDLGKITRPGERLAIWGWTPEYWVYSSTLLGTRDSVSIFNYTTNLNPNREYFRNRYVADFKRNRPEAFLDSGEESMLVENGDATYRTLPALAAIVDREYLPAGSWKRFHLYVRRDLANREIAARKS